MRSILFAAILALTSLPICASAQVGLGAYTKKQKMEQLAIKRNKISFFDTNLNLTPTEKEKFWALYDKIQAEKAELFNERQQLYSNITRYTWIDTTLANIEKRKKMDAYRATFKKENDLDNQLYQELLKILPIEKVAKFFILEKSFNDALIREYIEKRLKLQQQKAQGRKSIEEVKSPITLPFLENPNKEPEQSIILLPNNNTLPSKSHKNK